MGRCQKLQLSPFADDGLFRVHVRGQSALGVDQVQFQKQLLVVHQIVIQLRDSRRKLTQNAVYFRLLIQLQLPQLVVQIDDRLGFDEHRGAAAALVVDDPRHPSPVLLFDRDHVSAVADGHDGVLQDRPLGIQDVIDLRPDRVILADDGPPDGPKLGAGVVGHFIL